MIRRLGPEDLDAFQAIRREALDTDPLAFASSPEDDRGLKADLARGFLGDRDGQAVFVWEEGGAPVGLVGVYRDTHRKRAHRAGVWGMYVRPARRGRGIGAALLEAAIAHARTWPGVECVDLSVSEGQLAATRLYESSGFHPWGREERALIHGGREAAEIHLTLDLR